MEIDAVINQIKNLAHNKGKSYAELKKLAEERIKGLEDRVNVESLFEDKSEKKLAKELSKRYLKEYTIESVSDKSTLKQLVYLEVVNLRMQRILNDSHKENKSAPLQLIQTVHYNIDAIVKLKETLGITRSKEDESKTDAYRALDVLKRKFAVWRSENQGSRTIVCPECSKMILLKIRTDSWEAQRHPFFKDKILANEHLVKLYKEGKLTADDVAKILQVSPDYVTWLIDKWFSKKKNAETVAVGTVEA